MTDGQSWADEMQKSWETPKTSGEIFEEALAEHQRGVIGNPTMLEQLKELQEILEEIRACAFKTAPAGSTIPAVVDKAISRLDDVLKKAENRVWE